jgi:transcriptional regulator with XRE-family HTH domain
LGEIIRRQRELAALPIRQLATMAGISGPYLSQIERGLRAPSEAVTQAIADSLQTSAEALYLQAGFTSPDADAADPAASDGLLAAIRADPNLTGAQRRALAEVYRSFIDANRVRRAKRRSA